MTIDLLLSLDEARVLGVLIEKSMTTRDQYPLSLNALMNGCNQKSNRYPVRYLEPGDVRAAMDGLRHKQLAVEIWPSAGSRTEKFRHLAETALGLDDKSVAVIGELFLRRAQMPGELRTRASRMSPIDSQGELKQILDTLIERGMVVRLDPAPGSRAESYDHSLCADEAPGQATSLPPSSPSAAPQEPMPAVGATSSTTAPPVSLESVLDRLQLLEARVSDLEELISES